MSEAVQREWRFYLDDIPVLLPALRKLGDRST